MTLLEIRTQFIKLSGRADLVVDETDYINAGANFFIQSGQRHLQSLILTTKSEARILRRLATNANRISFTDCQSIFDVWIRAREIIVSGVLTVGERYEITAVSVLDFTADGAANSDVGTRFTATSATLTMTDDDNVIRLSYDDDEESFHLSKQPRNAIIDQLTENASLETPDLPQYWAPDIIRDADVEGNETLRGIVVGSAADQNYSLVIEGVFRPKKLTDDAHINFWTEEYPDLFLYAAFRSMESFYRNTQGVADWDAMIVAGIQGLDFDIVEEEGKYRNQVKG